MVPEFRDVTRSEYDTVPDQPEKTVKVGENWGIAAFVIVTGALCGTLHFFYIPKGSILSVVSFAYLMLMSIMLWRNDLWFERNKVIPATTKELHRDVTENQQVADHRSCIQCRHPIKVLK